MQPEYLLTELSDGQLGEVEQMLKEAGLPFEDIREPGRRFYRFDDALGPIGLAGLERYAADAMLRSVVVLEQIRGKANGRALMSAMMIEADRLGIERLWLLTTTAAGFFAKIGFSEVRRDAVPPAIASTREFASLCPASATCMMIDLKKDQCQ